MKKESLPGKILSKRKGAHADQGREFLAEQLEPRILYSGTVAPDLSDDHSIAVEVAESAPDSNSGDSAPTTAVQAAQQAAADTEQFVSEGMEIEAGETDIASDQMVMLLSFDSLSEDGEVGAISQELANELADVASERWGVSGDLTEEQEATLGSLQYSVVDLEGDLLVSVAEDNTILLDIDAAGRSWFVDGTPLDDSEFGERVSLRGFQADSGAAVAGVDVLTVLMEQQGAVLGFDDYATRDVTVSGLQPGLRRIPMADESLTNPEEVTVSLVEDLANAAKERWIQSGLDAAQIEALENIEYRVVNFDGLHIGSAENGVVTIDLDAAGQGWFVDLSPGDDVEFWSLTEDSRLFADSPEAAGHMDLLTTILHEQGHVLGLDHSDESEGDVMGGQFENGIRRLPTVGQAEGSDPNSLIGEHFGTSDTVTLFTLDFESEAGSTLFSSGGGNPSSVDTTVSDLGSTNNAGSAAAGQVWGMNTEFSTASLSLSSYDDGSAIDALNALPPGSYQLIYEYDQNIEGLNAKTGVTLNGTNGWTSGARGGTNFWRVQSTGHGGVGANQPGDPVTGDDAFSHVTISTERNGDVANKPPAILTIVPAGEPLTDTHVFEQGSFTNVRIEFWNTGWGDATPAEIYYDNISLSAVALPDEPVPLVNLSFDADGASAGAAVGNTANTGSLGGNATASGDLIYADSVYDGDLAAQFDEDGNVIVYSVPPGTLDANSDFTVAVNVYIDGIQSQFDRILDGFFQFADDTTAVLINSSEQNIFTTDPLSNGWHHFALSYDSDGSSNPDRGIARAYVDGVEVYSNVYALQPDFSTGLDLVVGNQSGGARPMSGLIDDVVFYDCLLLPDAIATIVPNNAPVATNDTAFASEAGGTNNATPGSPATGNVITGVEALQQGESSLLHQYAFSGSDPLSDNAGSADLTVVTTGTGAATVELDNEDADFEGNDSGAGERAYLNGNGLTVPLDEMTLEFVVTPALDDNLHEGHIISGLGDGSNRFYLAQYDDEIRLAVGDAASFQTLASDLAVNEPIYVTLRFDYHAGTVPGGTGPGWLVDAFVGNTTSGTLTQVWDQQVFDTGNAGFTDWNGSWRFGANRANSRAVWEGGLDSVAFYSSALTDETIAAHFGGSPGDSDFDAADTVGTGTSTDLKVTNISFAGAAFDGTSDETLDVSGDTVIDGAYGTLTIGVDGTYSYVANEAVMAGVDAADADPVDVFTYTISDDQSPNGATDTATLTIEVQSADDTTTLVYVNDDWAGMSQGAEIVDADLETDPAAEPAIFGATAFSSIQDAVDALGTNSGTIVVNGGDYSSETVDLMGTAGNISLQLVNDAENSEASVSIGVLQANGGDAIVLGQHGSAVDLIVGNNIADSNISGTVSGTGSLVKSGAKLLYLTGNSNTYNGGTVINQGTLRFTSDSSLGSVPGAFDASNITLNGGILKNNGPSAELNANRGITLGASGGQVDVRTDTEVTFNGAVSGIGGLDKRDGGTLILNGTNTYGGLTAVNRGTLQVASSAGLPSATSVSTEATLNLVSESSTQNFFSNDISGEGRILVTFTGSGTANTYLNGNSSGFTGLLELENGGSPTGNKLNTTGMVFDEDATIRVNDGTQLFIGSTMINDVELTGHGNTEKRGGIRFNNGKSITGDIILTGDTSIGTANATISGNITTNVAGPVLLTLGAPSQNNGNFNLTGVISDGTGTVSIEKAGTSITTLTVASSYTGTTKVTGGTLLVNGNNSLATGDITVSSGAILAGTGTVGGAVTVEADGTLAPGVGTSNEGTLTLADDLNLAGGATLDISGTNTTTHDLVYVAGALTISGTLNLVDNGSDFSALATGSQIELFFVAGDDSASTSGTFSGLSEGAAVSVGGSEFTISYKGDGGNDVVLINRGVADTSLDIVGGNLVITDTNGGNSDDDITLSVGDTGYTILDEGRVLTTGISGATRISEHEIFIPFVSISGTEIQVQGGEGSDTLTLDFGGNGVDALKQQVIFIGGENVGDNDTLTIRNGVFGTVTHDMTSGEAGAINLDSAGANEIVYSELEPIDMTGSTVTDFVFNLPTGADNAQLSESGGLLTLESTDGTPSFESTTFVAPSGSVTINGGAGDTLTISTALDLSANDTDLIVNVETIALNGASINTGTADQTYNGAVNVGAAAVAISADELDITGAIGLGGHALTLTVATESTLDSVITSIGGEITIASGVVGVTNPGNNLDSNVDIRVNAGGELIVGTDGAASGLGDAEVFLDGGTMTLSDVSTPPVVPTSTGMQAWYDAGTITGLSDGDQVTAWADQSGNGRDLVSYTGTPTLAANEINGQPAVRFNASNENLQMADPSNEYFAQDVFIVFRAGQDGDGATSNRTTFGPSWGAPIGVKDSDDNDRTWMFQGGEDRFWGNELPSAVRWNGIDIPSSSNFDMSAATGNASMGEYMVLNVTAGPNNGTQVREYIVGTRTDAWGDSRFDTAEIIAYDNISAADRLDVEAYLMNKYYGSPATLTNDVTVSGDSTINVESEVGAATLGDLKIAANATISFEGEVGGKTLEFSSVEVTDSATLNLINDISVTLPDVTETTASTDLNVTGDGCIHLTTDNRYSGETTIGSGASVITYADYSLGGYDSNFTQVWQLGTNTNNYNGFGGNSADEHYYFAGTYSARADGNADLTPATDEAANTFERELTNGDPANSIHFNLPAGDLANDFRLEMDFGSTWVPNGAIPFEVLVNGVSVFTGSHSADGDIRTVRFNGSDVAVTTGDNVIEIRRTDTDLGGRIGLDNFTLLTSPNNTSNGGTTVEAGGALAVGGGTSIDETITISGSGNTKFHAAIVKQSGGNTALNGAITLAGDARIQSSNSNDLDIRSGITMGPYSLTLDGDNRIDLDSPIVGTGDLYVVGNDRVDFHAINPGFSGDVTVGAAGIGEAEAFGRLDVHAGDGALGVGNTVTIANGSDAGIILRNDLDHSNDFVIRGDGRGTEGAIRKEGGTGVLTGNVTMTDDSSIYVNNGTLTIENEIIGGNFSLSKVGANAISRLILNEANPTIGNIALDFGQLRILNDGGLGQTETLSVDSGEAIEFEFTGSATYDSSTTFKSLFVSDGTVEVISGEVILDETFTLDLGPTGDINLGGDGELTVNTAFGNGTGTIDSDFLNHYGYRRDSGDANFDLNNNGGALNSGNPTGHASFTGEAYLTGALRFPDEASLLASGVFDTSISGYTDNFVNLWVGYLNTTEIGTLQLQRTLQDDWTGIWIDLDQDGVLESTTPGRGSNRGEQVAYNDGSVKSVNLTDPLGTGRYLVAFTQLEGGGNSAAGFQFKLPSGAALADVDPGDPAQAGLWTGYVPIVIENNVSKFGGGTTTFAGDNSYNGDTVIQDGTLVISSDTALGTGEGDVTVNTSATLAFDGGASGITVAVDSIYISGTGADGQSGVLVNLSGDNTLEGDITVFGGPDFRFANEAVDTELTLTGSLDMGTSELTVDGAGDITLKGNVSGAAAGTDPGPAAISGLEAWYDASTLTLNDGDLVTDWADQSGNGRDLVSYTGTPTFETNEINGNPAVRFNGNNENLQMEFSGKEYFAGDVYMVFRAGQDGNGATRTTFGPDWGAPIGVKDGDDADRTWMFQPGEDRFWGSELPSFVTRNGTVVSSANNFDLGGIDAGEYMVLQVAAGPNNGTQEREYIVGTRTDGWSNARFDTAEILAFDHALSGDEKLYVENYLGAKYGITGTFDNSISIDFSNDITKLGTGSLTLAGDNSYRGETNVEAGTVVVGHDNALGTADGGTTVLEGAILALDNTCVDLADNGAADNSANITIASEMLTLNGEGTGDGALVNVKGNNSIGAGSSLAAEVVNLGKFGIGSLADTLTIDTSIDMKSSELVFDGAGDIVVNGVVLGTGADVGVAPVENTAAVSGVFTNVPEASDYVLAYDFELTGGVNGANPFPYEVDNTATLQPFDRLAYYLELDTGSGLEWVYVSMDAFTNDVNQIGIPNGADLFVHQQIVDNMNVFASAGSGITTGTGLATGNIEIWPSNYGGSPTAAFPHASSDFDFGDSGGNTSLGYGSFQIHNHDLDGSGPGTNGETILAYNNWRSGAGDLGIGNRATNAPDYTFANNLSTYTLKRMAILVHESAPRIIQSNNEMTKEGGGTLTLSNANTYNGGTTIEGGLLLATNSADSATGSGDVAVEAGAILGGTGAVAGTVTSTGGSISPALSLAAVDDIGMGDLTLDSASTVEFQLNGTTPVTGHDQIDVTGTVSLGNSSLGLVLGYIPTDGDVLVLVDNDGGAEDPIVGQFTGLADGNAVTLTSSVDGNSYVFTIEYDTEDGSAAGNNVVLVSNGAVETSVEIDGSGNLVITDINGGVSDDDITITDDGAGNYLITDPNLTLGTSIPGATQVDANTISVAKTDIAGGLIVNAEANTNDTVTLGGTGTFTFAGAVEINAETINLNVSMDTGANDQAYNGAVTVGAAAVAVSGGGISFNNTGADAINLGANTLEIDGATASSVDGRIIGTGSFVKSGAGTLTHTTPSGHQWSGSTRVTEGILALGAPGGDAYRSTNWTIEDGGTVRYSAHNVVVNNSVYNIESGGTLDFNNWYDLIGGVSGVGEIDLGNGFMRLSTSSDFSGTIIGNGRVGSDGGTHTFSGTHTYLGTTSISGNSTFIQNGTHTGGNTYTVGTGATLAGTGSTTAAVTSTGGTITPGLLTGDTTDDIATGILTLDSASTYVVEIGGTAEGTDYDQIDVVGVNLNSDNNAAGGAVLNLTISDLTIPTGTEIVLINNSGANSVSGTFAGRPEGDIITLNDQTFAISYTGGDGNDVTLKPLNDAPILVDDTDTVTEAGGTANAVAGTTAVGNVLTNDSDPDAEDTIRVSSVTFGATMKVVPDGGTATIDSEYGQLVIGSDGAYTFTLNEANADVLDDIDTVLENFVYTVSDASADLVIAAPNVAVVDSGLNAGANPQGKTFGTGFSSVWDGTGTLRVAGGSLSSNFYNIPDEGNDTAFQGVYGQERQLIATLTTPISDDVWFSFLVNNPLATSVGGISFNSPDGFPSHGDATIAAEGTSLNVAGTEIANQFTLGQTALVVGRVGFDANGNEVIDVWVDPPLTTTAALPLPSGTASVELGAAGITRVGIVTYQDTGLGNTSHTGGVVDNFAIDTDLADVTGVAANPEATLAITITGANDTPVANADAATATELGGLNNDPATGNDATGNVLGGPGAGAGDVADIDVDGDDTPTSDPHDGSVVVSNITYSGGGAAIGTETGGAVTAGGTVVAGEYGKLTIKADGTYTYAVENSAATVQALDSSDSVTDVFTYTVLNPGETLSTTATITVTVNGNDDLTILVDDTDSIREVGLTDTGESTTGISGSVVANDVDVDDVVGSADVPVTNIGFAGTPFQSTNGGGQILEGTDSTNGTQIDGAYGTLTIGADGTYNYVLDDASVDSLTPADQVTETFTYTATGGETTAQPDIGVNFGNLNGGNNLNGTNGGTGVSGSWTGTATIFARTGNLSSSDYNFADTGGNSTSLQGTYGNPRQAVNTLTTSMNGEVWFSFLVNNPLATSVGGLSFNSPAGNSNPTTADIAVTAEGTDLNVGGTTIAGQFTLNQTALVLGRIIFDDAGNEVIDVWVDPPLTTNPSLPGPSASATAELGASVTTIGLISYNNTGANGTVNNGAFLDNVAIDNDFSDVTGIYSDTADLVITITGENDAPIATPDTNTAVEAGGLNNGTETVGGDGTTVSGTSGNVMGGTGATSGDSTDTDVDSDDDPTAGDGSVVVSNVEYTGGGTAVGTNAGGVVGGATQVDGQYGTLTINPDGSYDYVLNADASDALAAGETGIEGFTYTISDGVVFGDDFSGTGALNGVAPDNAPGAEAWTSSNLWNADGTKSSNGTASAWLPFSPEAGTVYTLSADVNPDFSTSADWLAIGFGGLAPDSMNLSQFQAGGNDGAAWMLFRENDGFGSVIQMFGGPDTQNGGSHDLTPDIVGSAKLEVILDTTGANWKVDWKVNGTTLRSFTYANNPTIASVGLGGFNTATGSIDNFSLVEGSVSSTTLTITVEGTNDTPEITSADQTGAITETVDTAGGTDSDPAPATGTITFDDADLSDTHTATVLPGASVTGGTATLTAAQEAALLDNLSLGAVQNDTPADGSGAVDWTYTVPNSEIDFLAAGETVEITHTVAVSDAGVVLNGDFSANADDFDTWPGQTGGGNPSSIAGWTHTGIVGINPILAGDSPFVNNGDNSTPVAFIKRTGSISQTVTGLTVGETYVLSFDYNERASGGSTTVSATIAGETFTDPNNSPVGGTNPYRQATLVFTATSTSETLTISAFENNGTDESTLIDNVRIDVTQDVVVTLTGANDTPVITSADQTGAITETGDDTAPTPATGTITFDDADLSDTHTATILPEASVTGGTATLTAAQEAALLDNLSLGAVQNDTPADGSGAVDWTYTVPNSEIDFLAAGETVEVTHTVAVSDSGVVLNGDFSANADDFDVYPGYLSNPGNPSGITGWTHTGSVGINPVTAPDGRSPFANNGDNSTPVAFIQGAGSISQTVSGLVVGQTYALTFDYNERATGGSTTVSATIGGETFTDTNNAPVGGANPYHQAVLLFTATAASETLTINGASNGGDQTTLIDNVRINVTQDVVVTITGANDAPEITSPDQTGAITEAVDNVGGTDADPSPATGTITFDDVDLTNTHTAEILPDASVTGGTATLTAVQEAALLNNLSLGAVQNDTPADGSGEVDWTYTVPNSEIDFLAAGETVEVTHTVFISDNEVVLNGNFEGNATDFTTFPGYLGGANPTDIDGWAEVGRAGINFSGAGGPGTPFANNGDNSGPVAFIQRDGSISQTVSGLVVGQTYTLIFDYNERAGGVAPNSTTVGATIAGATFTDANNSAVGGTNPYHQAVLEFTATATSEILTISGLTNGGDQTTLIDNVRIGVTQDVVVTITGTNDAPVLDSVAAPNINENQNATVTATFTDVDLSDGHTVTIDWDDPNNMTDSIFTLTGTDGLEVNDTFNSTDGAVLTITSIDTLSGEVTFTTQHQYLDDGLAPGDGTADNISSISVTVEDDDGGSANAGFDLTVENVAPQFANLSVTPTVINENGIVTMTGNIVDPGSLDAFTLVVDWGDGQSETVTLPAGSTSFSLTHQYTGNGLNTIALTLTDDDLGVATATLQVLANNVTPTVELDPVDFVKLGEPSVLTGSFTDIGLNDRHEIIIDWGDETDGRKSTFDVPPTRDLEVGDRIQSSTDGAVLVITGVNQATGEVGFRVERTYGTDGIKNIVFTVDDGDGIVTARTTATVFFILPTGTMPGIFTTQQGEASLVGILSAFRDLTEQQLFLGFRSDDAAGDRLVSGMESDGGFGQPIIGQTTLAPFFAGVSEPGAGINVIIRDEVGNIVGSQFIFADMAGNWSMSFPGMALDDASYTVEIQTTPPVWGTSESLTRSALAVFNGVLVNDPNAIAGLSSGQIVGIVLTPETIEEAVEKMIGQ